MIIRKIYIFIAVWLYSLSAFAQTTVRAEADKTDILIGDPITVVVTVENAQKAKIPDLKNDTLLLDIMSQTDPIQNGVGWQAKIVLTVFDSGTYTMPPIPVTVDDNGTTVYSNPIVIKASYPVTAQGDSARLAPLRPILEEGKTWEDYAPYIYTLLAALAIAAIVFGIIRYSKRKPTLPPPPPEIIKTPREIALEKLTSLDGLKLWQQGQIKNYYSELTFIVREFIENQYKIPALENTSSELYENLKNTDFPAQDALKIYEWLNNADLVKFAKMQPPTEVHEKAMGWAKQYLGEM